MANFCDDIVQNIERTECIGKSLPKINANFLGLEEAGCTLQKALTSLDDRVDAIEEIIGGSSPTLIGIRLSYSSTTPTPTTNILNATTLYVHPYKGNILPLFDLATNKWKNYKINSAISFPLTGLLANTNYDIYVYANGETLQAEFVAWANNSAGGGLPTRTYQDTVAVKSSEEPNKRLVGCLRTTTAGNSEQSFGVTVAGGGHPKQYLWNAQNIIPVSCYSFEADQYYYTLENGAWTGWVRTNYVHSTEGKNNRFSFIVGDNTLVNMISQTYPNWIGPVNHTSFLAAYTGMGVNSETEIDVSGFQMLSEMVLANQTPRAQLMKVFTGGYNYIQTFESIYQSSGSTQTINMNEGHVAEVGFLATIYM